jgi:hypothetical protein
MNWRPGTANRETEVDGRLLVQRWINRMTPSLLDSTCSGSKTLSERNIEQCSPLPGTRARPGAPRVAGSEKGDRNDRSCIHRKSHTATIHLM